MNKLMTFFRQMIISITMIMPVSVLAGQVEIVNPYMRELIPGTTVTSSYMKIINHHNVDIMLVGAKGKFSQQIELHEHTMKDGMMRMAQVPNIVIPANGSVMLEPSGLHIMAFDIKQPLKHGQSVELTLLFDEHPPVAIDLPIKSIKQQNNHHHHH